MDQPRALAFSQYAVRALAAEPGLGTELGATAGGPFDWSAPGVDVTGVDDADALALALRALRRRVFLHTMVRDLAGLATLQEVCTALTTLADVALQAAVRVHAARLTAAHGAPLGEETRQPQALIVIGMGKLGGGELNVSSDIDLVFVYPEEGDTAGPRSISNREYFDRLGRKVIATLNDVTAAGYVFRVDMRLRPYGDSGGLTMSFASLEQYLVTQGRAWERYAWLKARPITGERHDELAALVTPFVYRKYLDYDAYEELRDIRRQFHDQSVQRDYADNVKLGAGGIREIEFIAQAHELVRGGRERDLRIRGTLPALAALGARALLPPSSAEALRDAYVFLRNVEHRLQYRDDRQTHQLPQDPGERALIAGSMDLPEDEFEAALTRHRDIVAQTFERTLGNSGQAASQADPLFIAAWEDPRLSPEVRAQWRDAGYPDAEALMATLSRVRASSRYQQLPAASRQRFDTLVPLLLGVASAHPGLAGAQVVFERLLTLLETVARRSAYLALVIEHPPLLPRIANLMAASAWAADYLTRNPLLLDELLDARAVLAEPAWSDWRAELARLLAQRPDDAEHQMDVLRHFQHAQTFRLLVQDLNGRLTVERLADHLSALADVVLEGALAACWAHMMGVEAPPPRFAIIGYGKLGGKELGYASDLDIVFVFDLDAGDPDADVLEVRYTRLGQRLNTWLTSTTPAGQLYDTDLRLRPDGAKGLLVSSLRAFRKYQRDHAWIWEHQALTRARFVAGDAEVGEAFEAEREAILRRPRDAAPLRADVVAMRRKMHAGHPNPTRRFDLKHDAGGMVDIEFTVQYLVLAHAHAHGALTRNAGNIALLALAGELGLVPAALAASVADAYREYRRLQHKVRLTGAAHARVEPEPQAARRAAVTALWAHVFGEPWQTSHPVASPASAAPDRGPGQIS
ncbi:MAG: bifunctional [glutamate--ammonia ligase]-adenylyl-L-tyrosine phosphorylase/[glutamate--ammonia-ligase] adenylyltransferase [Casimicrobiaceae bacterium]